MGKICDVLFLLELSVTIRASSSGSRETPFFHCIFLSSFCASSYKTRYHRI